MEDATGKLKGTLFWGPNSVDGEIDETLLDGYDIWLVDACGEQYGHLGQVLKLDIRSKCCNTEAYNFTFDVIDMPKEPWTVRGREGLSTGRCGPSLHGCVRGTHEFHDHALQGWDEKRREGFIRRTLTVFGLGPLLSYLVRLKIDCLLAL